VTDSERPEAEERQSAGAGALLRMAREARGMSVAEVSAALKLSSRQIEAIENEDFSRLSGATFIRGFVRNYAKLLKVDAAPVLAALEEKQVLPQVVLMAPVDAGVKMPAISVRHGRGYLLAMLFAMAMLAVALTLYFDGIDLGGLMKGKKSPATASAPRSEVAQVVQPLPQPAAESPAADATLAAAPISAPPAAVPGTRQLVFSFDGSSWVEVKEASGRIVFSQMNAKGTTQVVEGRPPFQLVVGNASHVRLQYNDQPVDLRPHTWVEVARLTLE
jgi:cytoskeleton protein RodZ